MDGSVVKSEDERDGLELQLETALRVNFASAQNDVPIIKGLRLINHGEEAACDVTVSLATEPPVIQPKAWTVDRIAPGEEQCLHDLSTPLDTERLRGLNETEIGAISVSVAAGLHCPRMYMGEMIEAVVSSHPRKISERFELCLPKTGIRLFGCLLQFA